MLNTHTAYESSNPGWHTPPTERRTRFPQDTLKPVHDSTSPKSKRRAEQPPRYPAGSGCRPPRMPHPKPWRLCTLLLLVKGLHRCNQDSESGKSDFHILGSHPSILISKKAEHTEKNKQVSLDLSEKWGDRANCTPPNWRDRWVDTENHNLLKHKLPGRNL